MRRADRLFRLVQFLRNRRFATAAQIAEALEVSMRTVYRDIADLGASGVPIRGEAGVGYTLDRAFDLPPMTFTATEVEALALGARMVAAWADPALAEAARSVVEKVESVLPASVKGLAESSALFAVSGPWTVGRRVWLAEVRAAITAQRLLAFDYIRKDGATSRRRVRPLGLFFWGDRWLLAAWCELRQDYRTFRPDRMQAVTLDESFEPDPEMSMAGFKAQVIGAANRTG